MALKPRTRRKIIWAIVALFAALFLALIIAPHMITLNNLKPRLQTAIAQQTGIHATIDGDVHFSLLGRATIVAHDIKIPNGHVGAAMFSVPLQYLPRLESAPLNGTITIYNANIEASRLSQSNIPHAVKIRNSVVRFLCKDYEIIDGEISDSEFHGIVRTNQHKYEINYDGNEFTVSNRNNDLTIHGTLYADGGARGDITLATNDVNTWFEFSEPKIDMPIRLTMNFEWDGEYGFKFTDIQGENFSGAITLYPDGRRDIKLRARDLTYDFSFLLKPTAVFYDTNFDLDFYGDLKLGRRTFEHLKIQATGTRDALQISNIVADHITISGGTINNAGAHDMMIMMPIGRTTASCLFSGSPDAWTCREFTYGDMSGTILVSGGEFDIRVEADIPMPRMESYAKILAKLAPRGHIKFHFKDAAGTMTVAGEKMTPHYTIARGKPFSMGKADLPFLPDFMRGAIGDFNWDGDTLEFTPNDASWKIVTDGTMFSIAGKNFKQWFPDIDLSSVMDLPYVVSGRYKNGAIDNLKIQIADHTFTGTASRGAITLATEILNIDSFASQEYLDNYEEMEFLGPAPIMLPFELPLRVSINAETLIYNGDEFHNFIYSLRDNAQVFSISDNARGNMLATIEKKKKEYEISLQLNQFKISGALLNKDMPLNIYDTTITAEVMLTTYGTIAHDIWYNISGTADMSFDGGILYGIGIDEFFAAAPNITTLNAEYALSAALESGASRIKKMHITGNIVRNGFETTAPLTLSLYHADGTGNLEIRDDQMLATLNLTVRGTGPTPSQIKLRVLPDNGREYSLSDIMREFDAGYMRAFIKSHNRF